MPTVQRAAARRATAPVALGAAPPGLAARARDLLLLTRPGQWPKNLIAVPLPLLDAPIWTAATMGRLAWSVAAFIVASALVYVGNDLVDRETDRLHPLKRHRPLAAGRISVGVAGTFSVLLAGLLGGLLVTAPVAMWWPLPLYLLLNVAYSRWLKHVALLDIFVIAAGFQLRLAQGYLATGEPVSEWLLACAFAVCLLLVLGKRRHELNLHGGAHRPALRGYSAAFLELLLGCTCLLAITAYLLYLRNDAPLGVYAEAMMLLSLPAVLFGFFRYLQLVMVHRSGGDPVRTLLRDRALLTVAGLCALLFAVTLAAVRFPLFAQFLEKVV
jgi:decaprenyl-phosphate phosphoribosyltransferase